jgi:soluble lytic murein transglycosylase-like protein
VLAAVLEQETGGGANVFGHDPTIFAGAGVVTRLKYLAYKNARGSHGQGGMQGVGPMQLTWYSYQDKADKYGGAWNPRFNVRVGAEMLRDEFRQYKNWWNVFLHYNGSSSYANQVSQRVKKWQRLLS